MEQADWIENFIVCIQIRPTIYDKSTKEYSDRNVKERLWQEVCETVVRNWNELTSQEKINKGKDIQRKWQNLRSCFKRELRLQKETQSGQAKGKRRKYVYYDQLLFLLPTIQDRDTSSDITAVEPNEVDPTDSQQLDETIPLESPNTSQSQPTVPSVTRSKKVKMSYEESLLRILQDKTNEEIDEDKTFLFSLVPTFKKLNDDQKLQVKMEFLNVLRTVQAPTSIHPTSNLVGMPMQNTSVPHRQFGPSTSNYTYVPVHNIPQESRSSCSSYTTSPFLSPSNVTVDESQDSVLYELH